MARKRITQVAPWLLPIRKRQRLFCFYTKMKLDGAHYATQQCKDCLPYQLFETRCPMYNNTTGFDMVYQENKVFNLKLAAATLDKLIIRPQETFSFWQLVRYADRETRYLDGLATVNGVLTPQPGGGLCQLSNLLFWMFLHTPLTLVERHGHSVKEFPEPPSDAPMGVDATIAEGWLDLKVRNDTATTFQITITFDGGDIIGGVFTEQEMGLTYRVFNGQPSYYSKGTALFEEVDVIQQVVDRGTGACVSQKQMYRNRCQIGYPLPQGTPVVEKG